MIYALFIAGLLWFAFVLWRELKHDWGLIAKDKLPDHSNGWQRRLLWLLPTIALWVIPPLLKHPPEWEVLIWAILLLGSLWELFFGAIYNQHYNRSIFHIEKKHSWMATTDKILYPLPIWARAVLKIGAVIGSAILYFKTW